MKVERIILGVLFLGITSLAATHAARKSGVTSREFDFTYRVSLPNLPASANLLRIWIPVATTNRNQEVKLLKVSGTVPLRITREPEYGNRIAFAEIRKPAFGSAHFDLTYHVRRHEYSVGSFRQLMEANEGPPPNTLAITRFLQPDRLIPLDGEIKQIAEKVVAGRHGEISKAHAIYDYVFHNMRYDKSGTGWGHGDAIWACDSKHGNCTDFHSLFIGMMRAERIPARFVIGFPLPPDKKDGTIPGYHCWAEFYVADKGWVPVDISEAWLNPSKYGFFFGSVDSNRVRFSIGRDINLAPKQSGPPVNYFVYPYVELNGKPYTAVHWQFSFHETSS
jgi:transglutaminase-like putative cysteine protease